MRCFRLTEDKLYKYWNVFPDGEKAYIRIGSMGYPTLVPLSGPFQELLQETAETDLKVEDLKLRAADVSDIGELRIIQERAKSPALLLHVDICPGLSQEEGEPQGRLIYGAVGFDQRVIQGVVRRLYHSFPSPGVEMVAVGGDEPEALFRLLPGSELKLIRKGDTRGGWRALHARWSGRELTTRPPVKTITT